MSMPDFAMPLNSGGGIPSRINTGIIPRFRVQSERVPDQFNPETGLPLYKQTEMVELLVPGSRDIPDKRVTPAIKEQFRAEYDAWKKAGANADMAGMGVPLTHWPQIPAGLAAGLAHANIFTVEQLGGLSDTQCNIRGTIGLRKYRDMAATFIDQSKAAAPIAVLSAENELLKNRLALLEKQVEQVNERAAKAEAKSAGADDALDLSTPRDGKKGKN